MFIRILFKAVLHLVTACRTDAGDSRSATRFALANMRWRGTDRKTDEKGREEGTAILISARYDRSTHLISILA